MPRGYQINLSNAAPNHDPTQKLSFDPTSVLQQNQGTFAGIQDGSLVLQEMVDGFVQFLELLAKVPGELIGDFVNTLLTWFDDITGLNFTSWAAALEALFSGSDDLLGSLVTYLENLPQEAIDGLTAIWDDIFGTTTPGDSQQVLNTAITDIFGTGSLGQDVERIVNDAIGALGGSGSDLTDLVDALFNIPAANVVGLYEHPYVTGTAGHGALKATAHATKFTGAASLSGHGALTSSGSAVIDTTGGLQPVPGGATLAKGHGALTAVAHATKFVLPAALSGHGSFTASGGGSIGQLDQTLMTALWDALTGGGTGTVSELQIAFDDLMTLLGNPFGLGTGSPVASGPASTPLLGTLSSVTGTSVTNDIFNNNSFWTSLMSLLFPNNSGSVGTAVTSTAVSGLLGPMDIGSSLQASVDALWNALTSPATYQSGQSLQTLASAAQNLWNTLFNPGAVVETTATNSAAITAQALGNVASTAVDSSANAVFPISQISGSTPTTITVDQADSAIGYILVPFSGTKETVIWLGQTQGTLSSFVINLYQVNTSNGALTYLFSSPDLSGILSGTLGWNYWNITNSVALGAVGAGANTGTTATYLINWSHTVGVNDNLLLVNISVNAPSSPFDYQGYPNMTVQFGAGLNIATMTLYAAVNCNNGTTGGWNAVYYLQSPPIGVGGVTVFSAPSSPPNVYMSGNSVSYSGVASLGAPVTNFGSSTSPTTGAITSASGDMVFAGFSGLLNTKFTSPSGTSRYVWPTSTNAAEQANLIQDAAGASSVTLSATLSSSQPWSAIGVNLVASNALAAAQNDVYAVEVTVQGTGYYSMVGIPNHWLPPNTNVFPTSLGATRDSYISPVWDANGVGATGGSSISSLSWSHTNAANAYLLVAVVEYSLAGNPTITATYNGVSMANLGSSVTGAFLKIYLFGLSVTASGTHTVAVSSNTNGWMSGRSTSFTGVTGVGTFNGNSGVSASPAASGLQNTGDVLFGAIGSQNSAITIAGNNSWQETNSDACMAGSWLPMTQDGTLGGLANITGSMTSGSWVSAGIPLLGAETTPGDISAPTYSNDVPWIGIGGSAGITQQTPATQEMAYWYSTADPTTGAYTYTIPAWVISDYNNGQNDLIDIIMVGGGAGGDGGTNFGGGGGSWTVVTLTYGTQITGGTTTITGVAGPGGAGASGTSHGSAGTNTTAVATGYGTITAAGGVPHNAATGAAGASSGNQVWNNITYYGGSQENTINYGGTGGTGNAPGGGGSTGGSFGSTNYSGGNGASGVVWFVARQPS